LALDGVIVSVDAVTVMLAAAIVDKRCVTFLFRR
jgi:hypothetical protein